MKYQYSKIELLRVVLRPKSAGPCLSGATRLRGVVYQSLISDPNFFSELNHKFINLCNFPLTNQQLINQLMINLLFAGLQISNLGLVTVLLYPGTITVWCLRLGRPWKYVWIKKTFPSHVKTTKVVFASRAQNDIKMGAWNHTTSTNMKETHTHMI